MAGRLRGGQFSSPGESLSGNILNCLTESEKEAKSETGNRYY